MIGKLGIETVRSETKYVCFPKLSASKYSIVRPVDVDILLRILRMYAHLYTCSPETCSRNDSGAHATVSVAITAHATASINVYLQVLTHLRALKDLPLSLYLGAPTLICKTGIDMRLDNIPITPYALSANGTPYTCAFAVPCEVGSFLA